MIGWLQGKPIKRLPDGLIVDVKGVGYRIHTPLTLLFDLPKSEQTPDMEFWIYTRVKEDALQLYGFKTYQDRECFEMLLSVNKVGPKVALAIMSTLTIDAIIQSVEFERPEAFKAIPGIGAALASKVVIELKNKVKKLSYYHNRTNLKNDPLITGNVFGDAIESQVLDDIRSALDNLGFKSKDIEQALNDLPAESHDWEFSKMMRVVLNTLNGPKPVKKAVPAPRELF